MADSRDKNILEQKETKILAEDSQDFILQPLYHDTYIPDTIIIDDKSKKLLALGKTGQRYAVVGWVIDDKLHLRFRPGLPYKAKEEDSKKDIEEATALFGEGNFVQAKPNQPGMVHAETINQVEAEEPEIWSNNDPKKGRYRVLRKMIGFSVEKDEDNTYIWLNRSALNLNTFERDKLAIACNFFKKHTEVEGTRQHLLEYHLNRSIPERYFRSIAEKATTIINAELDSKENSLENCIINVDSIESNCYSFTTEQEWEKIRKESSRETQKNKIKELIRSNIYRVIHTDKEHPQYKIASLYESQIRNALQTAAENNIDLNLDDIPLEFKKLGSDTVFSMAASSGNLNLLKILLHAKRININHQDTEGQTPLHKAAIAGQIETVQYLIEQGADPAIKSNNDMDYFAYLAKHVLAFSEENNHEKIRKIFTAFPELKKYIDLPNSEGNTALLLAATKGHVETAKLLISLGANPLQKNHDDFDYLSLFATHAFACANQGNFEKASAIVDNFPLAKLTFTAPGGNTQLHIAMQDGSFKTAHWLIEKKLGSLTKLNDSGKSSLDYLIETTLDYAENNQFSKLKEVQQLFPNEFKLFLNEHNVTKNYILKWAESLAQNCDDYKKLQEEYLSIQDLQKEEIDLHFSTWQAVEEAPKIKLLELKKIIEFALSSYPEKEEKLLFPDPTKKDFIRKTLAQTERYIENFSNKRDRFLSNRKKELAMHEYFHDVLPLIKFDEYDNEIVFNFITRFDFSFLQSNLEALEKKNDFALIGKVLNLLKAAIADFPEKAFHEAKISNTTLSQIQTLLLTEKTYFCERAINNAILKLNKEIATTEQPHSQILSELKKINTILSGLKKTGSSIEAHLTEIEKTMQTISFHAQKILTSNSSQKFYKNPPPTYLQNLITIIKKMDGDLTKLRGLEKNQKVFKFK